jgi:hypothetical protein
VRQGARGEKGKEEEDRNTTVHTTEGETINRRVEYLRAGRWNTAEDDDIQHGYKNKDKYI